MHKGVLRVPRGIMESGKEGCLHELFERQADLTPEAPALICGDEILSYAELDRRSNRLARYLVLHGAGPGKFVGIYFGRSEKPIIAILACLKSGAAYVPIDPAYPSERVRGILAESEAILLLTEDSLLSLATEYFDGPILAVDFESRSSLDPKKSRFSPGAGSPVTRAGPHPRIFATSSTLRARQVGPKGS